MIFDLRRASPIYFDISDIVHFAQSRTRVSGIQRVSVKMISSLLRWAAERPTRCLYVNPLDGVMYEVDAAALFDETDFRSSRMLARLGAQDRPQKVLSKGIKHHLRPFEHQKLRRAAIKLKLLALGVSQPDRLRHMGLPVPYELGPGEALAPRPVDRLASTDTLVELGAPWTCPTSLTLCRQHRERGGRVVQLIHDVIPAKHPELFPSGVSHQFNHFLDTLPEGCSEFLCVSQSTAKDLAEALAARGVTHASITVIPLAHEMDGFARNQAPACPDTGNLKALIGRPFALCVGTLEERKNGANLLRAWAQVHSRLGPQTPKLVFAGSRGWGLAEFDKVLKAQPQLRDHVEILIGPTDEALAWLYRHCLFHIYPSLYEGWGLPPGEAAWFGTFSIVSNTSSLPEVLGPLAAYVDPHSIDDMARQIIHTIIHPQELELLRQRITSAPLRSWVDVGQELHQYLMRGADVIAPERQLAANSRP